MAKRLTAQTIEQAKPGAARREIPDGGCPGLRLIIQPKTGAKSWALRFRSPVERGRDGQRAAKKLVLGPFATEGSGEPEIGRPLTLVQARKLATAALETVARGIDPTHVRREQKAKAKRQVSTGDDSIDAALVDFMKRHLRKRDGKPIRWSTRCETARLLGLKPDPKSEGAWIRTGGGVLRHWRGRTLKGIAKSDVLDLIEEIAEDAPVGANRTLAALKTFCTWCVKRDKLDNSPAAAVDDPSPENSPARALEDHELAAMWRAAEAEGYPFGPYYQMMILTGQRRGEVRNADWNKVDLDKATWLIPSTLAKNDHDHLVPLSPQIVDILKKVPRIEGKRGLVFTTNGKTPISGLSKAKTRIKKRMDKELRAAGIEPQPWRPHDLRHSVKTWMQRTRVPKDVRNAVQNHHDRDMDALYGHYTFEPEKRTTLDLWARHVDGLVNAREPAKVISMARPQIAMRNHT